MFSTKKISYKVQRFNPYFLQEIQRKTMYTVPLRYLGLVLTKYIHNLLLDSFQRKKHGPSFSLALSSPLSYTARDEEGPSFKHQPRWVILLQPMMKGILSALPRGSQTETCNV
jgi:hypothetical protein